MHTYIAQTILKRIHTHTYIHTYIRSYSRSYSRSWSGVSAEQRQLQLPLPLLADQLRSGAHLLAATHAAAPIHRVMTLTHTYIHTYMLAAVLTNGNYHVRSAHQHCFCGYKYLGNLVDRCDCTRSGSLPYIHSYSLPHIHTYSHTYIGDADNNCMEEHEKLLYEETYAETGEYVSCNNCNSDSP